MYDMLSRLCARCLCNTRIESTGRKSHHKAFRDTGQQGPESQRQEVIPNGHSACQGIGQGCRKRPVR